jgi:ribonuclease HI
METAVVVRGVAHIDRDLGLGTSLDVEWLALIRAVEIARDLGVANPLFLGDALGVVRQANRVLACRGAAAGHLQALEALAGAMAPLHIRHVKRTQNLAGIALAKLHAR